MTPTEVWEGFDAQSAPLETSIIFAETTNHLVHERQVFLVENTQSGKLSAVCDLYYDDRWVDARSAILILPSLREANYMDQLTTFVHEGYVCCVLDYCNRDGGDVHTTFTKELDFAEFPECLNHLDGIENSARNTPWFVWAKIARRAITMLENVSVIDKNHIGVLGLGTGAELGWQVVGIDKRVRAFVAVNGGGYRWTKGDGRFVKGNVFANDEQLAYSTGVGAETYAKFITCPTLFIGSQSSLYNDVDRMTDILELVKSNAEQMIISTAGGEQITKKEFQAMLQWLRNYFALTGEPIKFPTIEFEVEERRLYVRVNSAHTAKVKTLYINYGEEHSTYRFWQAIELDQKVGVHEYIASIPVYDANELIVAYATFEYQDGDVMSTKVIGTIPARLDVRESEDIGVRESRIIYDGSMGLGSFQAETRETVLNDNNLHVAIGPFNIKGISAHAGDIMLCRNMRETNFISQMSAIHIDAYSPIARELEVSVLTYPDLKRYTARKTLQGGEFWQNILLECSDFKSEEGRTLQKFVNGKLLTFHNVDNMIFNNFLWI